MAVRRKIEIPELYPQPRMIDVNEGLSELSMDIRLVTNNVFPLQRKAIRSILTAIGVKVVANKKRYVVEARVESPEAFQLDDVPEAVRHDYYELRIQESEVYIRTPYQEGTVWASQTLAGIFQSFLHGRQVPNLTIRDWPRVPVRALSVTAFWGTDRMGMADWYQLIETLSSLKMNVLSIDMDGSWKDGDSRSDWRMAAGAVETPHRLRWYTVKEEEWRDETYLPMLYQNNLFGDVINYGRERGICVIPTVHVTGRGSLFAALLSKSSKKGTALKDMGALLASEDYQESVFAYVGEILDRYYPQGVDCFRLELNQNSEEKAVMPSLADNLVGFVKALAELLLSKGVKKVVFGGELVSVFGTQLDAAVSSWLAGSDHSSAVVWDLRGDASADMQTVQPVWTSTCFSGMTIGGSVVGDSSRQNEWMCRRCAAVNGQGMVLTIFQDAVSLESQAEMAWYAWNGCDEADESALSIWRSSAFRSNRAVYEEGREALTAVMGDPLYRLCLYGPALEEEEELHGSANGYPEKGLTRMAAMASSEEIARRLHAIAEQASSAESCFCRLLEQEDLDESVKISVKSLRGEAVRARAAATVFAMLVELRQGLENGMVKKSYATTCLHAKEAFVDDLKLVEQNKPMWSVPVVMQGLGAMLAFLDQLHGELVQHAARKQAAALHWSLIQ